jgi:hypothetical protein
MQSTTIHYSCIHTASTTLYIGKKFDMEHKTKIELASPRLKHQKFARYDRETMIFCYMTPKQYYYYFSQI